jgi:hypothetical protein
MSCNMRNFKILKNKVCIRIDPIDATSARRSLNKNNNDGNCGVYIIFNKYINY